MKIGNRTLRPIVVVIAVALLISALLGYKVISFAKEKYHYLREHIDNIEELVDYDYKRNTKKYNFDYSWVNDNKYVAHAMGGLNEYTYSNSLEAFNHNYEQGHRIFEVDFDLTSDYYMIASHDEDLWRQQAKIEDDEFEYSLKNFKESKICNGLTTLDYKDIVNLLNEHKDMYVITDSKYSDEYKVRMQFSQLVNYAKQVNAEVLNRIIPQIYSERMLDYLMSIHEFKSVIYTMYQLPEIEIEDIANFCSRSGVGYVTISEKLVNEDIVKQFNRFGIKVGTHSVDDKQRADELFNIGVDQIYTNYLLPDKKPVVVNEEPNETYKIINIDDGYLFYNGSSYRYGPSIMKNEDGSYDAWISSPGNNSSQWDYITYSHSNDGYSWSKQQVVLTPTAGSKDQCSVCDPGLVFFNGYYYMGYTSTDYYAGNGSYNSAFVARSKNPNGPFEKWNGEGWGGNPEPIIAFNEDKSAWGIGEISFVVKDEQLYIYYTYDDAKVASTKLMISDLSENWPLTMEDKGVVYQRNSNDSFDVAYIEDKDRFVAFAIKYRMDASSQLIILSSTDGLNFTQKDWTTTKIERYAHNCGISKSNIGHIVDDEELIVGYAFGSTWGRWPCKFQRIRIDYTLIN